MKPQATRNTKLLVDESPKLDALVAGLIIMAAAYALLSLPWVLGGAA